VSAEAAGGRRGGWRRVALVLVASLAVLGGLAAWALPFRYVRDLRVESARVLGPGDGPVTAGATPRRIAVTFTAPYDLERARADEDLGLIAAQLSACDGDGAAREVVTQRADYLADRGRVTALGPAGPGDPRRRYRAVFDDRLTNRVDGRSRDRPATGTPGGLCFSLTGGSVFAGALWSNTVPLAPSPPD